MSYKRTLFSRMYVTENEEELYCQTISMGKFIDVNKKEVLEISKFGPWKSLKSPWIFGLKKCANPVSEFFRCL